MRVLLVSTYELGHQPLHAASAAAALLGRGHDVRCVDTAIDPWDPVLADDVDAVAIAVPMHTAMRLATGIAGDVRARRPEVPVALYGLYAGVAAEHTLGRLVDRTISGEYERALCEWVDHGGRGHSVELGRSPTPVPARGGLPGLDRYARLSTGGAEHLAAAVETTRGCRSRCRHCPVSAVYDGRTRVVARDDVLADIAHLVGLGVRHVTFADPDFLSAPQHSLRVLEDAHRRFPALSFDLTTKVAHVLAHRTRWKRLAAMGCLFVTTAVECVDDAILAVLDKGHTATDAAEAIGILRDAGIAPRPTLLPFTPWTTLDGLVDLVRFTVDHELADAIDPVQWTLRLLVPDGSLLLRQPDIRPFLDGYDAAALGWRWRAADPAVDDLHGRLADLVRHDANAGADPRDTFAAVAATVASAAGVGIAVSGHPARTAPRLTETRFCCAEPTCAAGPPRPA
jgi:radical SAM superfamily enzyme YgiQ (UPF0313 family)